MPCRWWCLGGLCDFWDLYRSSFCSSGSYLSVCLSKATITRSRVTNDRRLSAHSAPQQGPYIRVPVYLHANFVLLIWICQNHSLQSHQYLLPVVSVQKSNGKKHPILFTSIKINKAFKLSFRAASATCLSQVQLALSIHTNFEKKNKCTGWPQNDIKH